MNEIRVVLLSMIMTGCTQDLIEEPVEAKNIVHQPETPKELPPKDAEEIQSTDFRYPLLGQISNHDNAAMIQRGKTLIENTYVELPEYVQAQINCTNCHLNAGTVQNAMPFVGVDDRYPKYRSRSGKEDTLAERINGCFQRSMNGRRLSENSPEMKAMIAYMEWLSMDVDDGTTIKGIGLTKLDQLVPNIENGKLLFQVKCQLCHENDGSGLVAPNGSRIYPPLWGENAYNVGAGMARLNTAAAFIKWNMPFGQGGSLSDQEAYDIAAYFTTQERPDFLLKQEDWPKGGKPNDARY